jgi:hypothetical protein
LNVNALTWLALQIGNEPSMTGRLFIVQMGRASGDAGWRQPATISSPAVLIAQSLNQIEKAYGPNNSILDNCHVRVCFATNDKRTARRVSDALGVATEMRAIQNYAGHRLAPWLGHIMVSR